VRRAGGERDAQPEAELGDTGAANSGPDLRVRVGAHRELAVGGGVPHQTPWAR
jgi:hypothetical protein